MKNKITTLIVLILFFFSFNKINYYSNILIFIKNELTDFVFRPKKVKYIKNDQIISHAGGAIKGFIYTNSLQSLDYNYSKGSRFFEIDIRRTKDNHYVGVHDWNEWVKMTGFNGDLPPTLEEFKKLKIYKRFTPLDMNTINLWFENHSDAVLVTDKIDDPIDFIPNFKFRNRLMMELFSIESIKKGLKEEIDVMASWSAFNNMNDEKIISLVKNMKIKYISVPNGIVYSNPVLLKKLSSFLKIYSYGSYKASGTKKIGHKTETYVLCKESEYFYGVYADEFLSNKKISCNEF